MTEIILITPIATCTQLVSIKYDDWEYGDYYEWTDSGKDYSLRSFEDHEVNITIIKGIE